MISLPAWGGRFAAQSAAKTFWHTELSVCGDLWPPDRLAASQLFEVYDYGRIG